MALLIVFESLIGRKAAECCRVWLQGLAWVWPGFGQGLTRVWLKGFVSGIGCSIAEDIDRKVHGLVLRLAELSSPYSMVCEETIRNTVTRVKQC